MAQQLMTVREAAAYLRYCPESVRKFFKQGRLKGRRIGRSIRFTREDLESAGTDVHDATD